jgi:hypothetical protein
MEIAATYVDLNSFVELHTFIERDLQRGAVWFQSRKILPLGWLSVDFHTTNIEMVGVQNDMVGLAMGGRTELMDNISSELFLIKEDVKIRCDMSGHPIIVIAQGIWIPGGVDNGRHVASLAVRKPYSPPGLNVRDE